MLLKEYLQEYGVKTKWFAERLGVSHAYLRQLLCGRQKIPKKFWPKILELTQFKVTEVDIENNFIGYLRDKPRC